MTAERKKRIYDICVKYDVIIVEDDRERSLGITSGSLSLHLMRFSQQRITSFKQESTSRPPHAFMPLAPRQTTNSSHHLYPAS